MLAAAADVQEAQACPDKRVRANQEINIPPAHDNQQLIENVGELLLAGFWAEGDKHVSREFDDSVLDRYKIARRL